MEVSLKKRKDNILTEDTTNRIINDSLIMLYEYEIKNDNSVDLFFTRPLIKKGLKIVRDILKAGGKNDAIYCKKMLDKNIQDLYVLCKDILKKEEYFMYLKVKNLNDDLSKDVLKGLYVYITNELRDKESNQTLDLSKSIRNKIYEQLNPNYIQLFFKTILGFRRYTSKESSNETTKQNVLSMGNRRTS